MNFDRICLVHEDSLLSSCHILLAALLQPGIHQLHQRPAERRFSVITLVVSLLRLGSSASWNISRVVAAITVAQKQKHNFIREPFNRL
jgi:hypothetical protein